MEDIISAISTPPGTGGVAIIRLSGKGSLGLASRMFHPAGGIEVDGFEPNRMYAGRIECDGFFDFGYCVYFAPPRSFTGGEVVEFHCHGGAEIARGVLKKTFSLGARAAERGEFTKRAFVAGKLSLCSAEGMIDMINAECSAQLRAGNLLYGEKLKGDVEKVRASLTDLLASIAADTDYPEEGIEEDELADIGKTLDDICVLLKSFVGTYSVGKLIKSGVSVAICGKPNAGKSSLLNALLGYDKAIVSPIAGTTRDTVEGRIEIDGVVYNLYDTAGIREEAESLEQMGIERAKNALASSDVALCLSDEDDFSAVDGVGGERLIKVFSKCDIKEPYGDYDVAVSSVTGEGLEELKGLMRARSFGGRSLDSAYITEERHYECLCRALEKCSEAAQNCGKFPLDLLTLDIREAWRALGEITGDTADEEIINRVFAKFCVGK